MASVCGEFLFCVDCYGVEFGGVELEPCRRSRDICTGLERLSRGRRVGLYPGESSGVVSFSRRPCECCGSVLAGQRLPVVALSS